MYEIFIHNETHTYTHAHTHTKSIYLKSNKSARAAPERLTLKYIFNTLLSVFMYLSLVHANSLLTFEAGQYVRLLNRITFEGPAIGKHTYVAVLNISGGITDLMASIDVFLIQTECWYFLFLALYHLNWPLAAACRPLCNSKLQKCF